MKEDDQLLIDLADFVIAEAEKHDCKPEEVLIDVTPSGFKFAGVEKVQ